MLLMSRERELHHAASPELSVFRPDEVVSVILNADGPSPHLRCWLCNTLSLSSIFSLSLIMCGDIKQLQDVSQTLILRSRCDSTLLSSHDVTHGGAEIRPHDHKLYTEHMLRHFSCS